MILEGIVTTLSPERGVNVAPMGPRIFPPYDLCIGTTFELRPFQTATTFANLSAHPEGVLHVHDDVLLLARAAVGELTPLPTLQPAHVIRGQVLSDACRACEFRIVRRDDRAARASLLAEIVFVHHLRDFFGFNRARHAVLEAAILATRTALLPLVEIESEYARLAVLVEKTGGPRELEAFAFLREFIARSGAS